MSLPGPRFRVRAADPVGDHAAFRHVRETVFVQEQGVPRAIEADALDPECFHVLAEDAQGRPIGTGRVSPERRIGRMAVLPAWRGHGVGTAMLLALVRHACDAGWPDVSLHSQASAIGFYRRLGFVATGPRFMEAGIEHQSMRLRLDRPMPVEDRRAAVMVTACLVAGARTTVYVRSRELDPGLFDAPEVLDALRTFATRGGRDRQVLVLLHDAGAVQRAHAPLLDLAQRLPSMFAFRELDDPADRNDPSAMVATDGGGYYHRPLGHRFDGEWMSSGRARARQWIEAFKPVWERSRPCTGLRALGL